MSQIADAISPISRKIERVQDSAGKLEHEASPKKAPEIQVRQTTSWTSYLVRGMGSVWGAIIIAGVVSFLVFFMLLAGNKIFFCLKTILGKKLDVGRIDASRNAGFDQRGAKPHSISRNYPRAGGSIDGRRFPVS